MTTEINLLQKYQNRGCSNNWPKYFYTAKAKCVQDRPIRHTYGNLFIDNPKLYGLLKLFAYKNGVKAFDKRVDFDTLDLLTNLKKNYSQLSKMVFYDLNRLSEIPIQRT